MSNTLCPLLPLPPLPLIPPRTYPHTLRFSLQGLGNLISYDTALSYLQHSLVIRREIGDLAGLCSTFFNMGNISWEKEDRQQAVAYWVKAYQIAKQIGYAQALVALDSMAKQLGGKGVEMWEELAG